MTPSSKRVSRSLCLGMAGFALVTYGATLVSPAAAQPQEESTRWVAPPQPVDDATLERARDIYRSGRTVVENGNLESGLAMFEESYQVSGAWMALFAVGHTLNDLGRHDEAASALAQLLEDHADVAEEFRAEARIIIEQVAASQAWLSLSGLPTSPGITLDGTSIEDTGERPLVLPARPGQHALNIQNAGFEPFVWQGFALAGGNDVRAGDPH